MKKLLLVVLLFSYSLSFGQEISRDSVLKLVSIYKPLLESDTIDFSKRKVTKLKEDLFKVEDFYPSDKLASIKFSGILPQDKYFPEKETSTEYFENGEVKRVSRYNDSLKVRQVKQYFSIGSVFQDFETDLTGITVVKSVLEPNGKHLVIGGNGDGVLISDLDFKGKVESGKFMNGKRMGEWIGYYKNGDLYYKEVYKEGKLVFGQSFDENGNRFEYKEVEVLPEFIGGYNAMFRFLGSSTNYPKDAVKKNITGRVTVRFSVEKDGSISNVIVLRPVYPSLDEEAVRVIKAMSGRWNPGLLRGMPVKVFYTIPVLFSLS